MIDNTIRVEIIQEYKKRLIQDFIDYCIECEVSPTGDNYSSTGDLIHLYLKERNDKDLFEKCS